MLSHLLLAGGKIGGAAAAAADGVMKVFDRLKCIQFDPLSIAGRNHDIALHARVRGYTPAVCDRLLYTERRLLDAWDKKMCVIRAVDLPWYRPFHEEIKSRLAASDGPVYPLLERVRAHIGAHGPTTAKMLDISGEAEWGFGIGNWGSPNPGRVVLEAMLAWGELVVANKDSGRKAYDFTEKLLSQAITKMADPYGSYDEYAEWRVSRRVSSVGIIRKGQSSAWAFAAILTPEDRVSAIARLLRSGRLLPARIDNLKSEFLVCAESYERYLDEGYRADDELRFIAPLDNLLWDKSLIRTLFDFDYHWEVYDPPQKRKFGYYVIPILYGDEFVGRIEPVFKKGDEAMRVEGFWWNADAPSTRNVTQGAVRNALEDYARFLGASGYIVEDAAKGGAMWASRPT